MHCKASKKVQGGKLVRIELDLEHGRIIHARITGDFFMHPEEKLSQLEACLVGLPVELNPDQVFGWLLSGISRVGGDITLYGVSLKDMAETVVEAFTSQSSVPH